MDLIDKAKDYTDKKLDEAGVEGEAERRAKREAYYAEMK
jgi:hypothetical protein